MVVGVLLIGFLAVLLSYVRNGPVLVSIFFFKQKTAYEIRISDWSSDVCSSDLPGAQIVGPARLELERLGRGQERRVPRTVGFQVAPPDDADQGFGRGVVAELDHKPGQGFQRHRRTAGQSCRIPPGSGRSSQRPAGRSECARRKPRPGDSSEDHTSEL